MLTLNAAGLFVTDIDKMVAFYRDVMGMETDWDGTPNAELYSGGLRLIMFPRREFEQMTKTPYTYPAGLNGTMEISFGLPTFEEVDREYERVVKAGAKPIFPPTDEPWGQRTSYVADPDGNLIEISSFNEGKAG